MMESSPLACACGNRLGFKRDDGAFVSRNRGRTVISQEAFSRPGSISVICERCSRSTDVAQLRPVVVE